VPGAILIPLDQVPDRLDELPTDRDVLVVCRTGARSLVASEFLLANGIRATNVAGGTLAWVSAGNDVVEGSSPS
jgi:rhodanese-related sulfurtransferase